MRYCLYAEPEWVKQSYNLNPQMQGAIPYTALPRIFHSGLTNWAMVFEGVYNVPNTMVEYGSYDVIHVNMTPHGVGNIKKIKADIARLESKKPLVIANVDHAINMWEGFGNFEWFIQDLLLADRLFCVHPLMSDTLSTYINRPVCTIPHPTNLDQFDELRSEQRFDIPTVVVFVHSYDVNVLIVTEALKALKRKYKFQILLIGNAERKKEYVKWNYDQYIPGLPFHQFAKIVGMCNVAIDTAITHSYGRVGVESAALGVPCIGNFTVESIKRLWPELVVDVFNAKQITEKVESVLFGDQEHRQDIIRTAQEGVVMYGYPACKQVFEDMINADT
jgi:hypothetical protein